MGTRHLIAVQANDEYKIAQYGQWDGYPDGQGVKVLEFASQKENLQRLRDSLAKVRFLDQDGKDKEFMDSYNENCPEWSRGPDNRTDEQKRWFKSYISRDLGADILQAVADSNDDEIILSDSLSFAGDSLFCEWAYVIDLDKNTLEVFSGFNHEEITEGRFKSGDELLDSNDKYQPVKLVKEYSLDNLPTSDQFLADLEPDEDEEDAA